MSSALSDLSSSLASERRHAVLRSRPGSLDGALERLFSAAFGDLVYPQIWEDPVVDMEAMDLGQGHRVLTIASGGCNVLSYLTAAPDHILAVDLNPAHVALLKLKLAAARHLDSHADFLRFFGDAASERNVRIYDGVLRQHLDAATRAYWDRRDKSGRRRITRFARGFHRYGLLGRFIGAAHLVSRLHGVRPADLLEAATAAEQREFFERRLGPVFDTRIVRWITDRRIALYGLGIPPAQFDKLAAGRPMAEVLKQRLGKLACDFPVRDNYFAWQAFARRYDDASGRSLPPYLQPQHHATLRRTAHAVEVAPASLTTMLERSPSASFDRYVLLDAQDWMDAGQINRLWAEIGRTAREGSRVIFRTAGEDDIVADLVEPRLLGAWRYEWEESRAFTLRDRSAVYGAFHLYTRRTGP